MARFELRKKASMSISNVKTRASAVNPTNAPANEKLTKQYQEQYQQSLSQYETALATWSGVPSASKTCMGEAVCLAIAKQLTETDAKLKELQAVIYALGEMVDTEAEEVKNKKRAEVLGALLSKLTANISAVTTLSANDWDINALRKIWEGLSKADKAYLGEHFTQTIDAQFSALNAKISELKKAIEEGADPSIIKELQTEISKLTTQLSALIKGTADGFVMSVTDRIACLKSLGKAKQNQYINDDEYMTFVKKLSQTDISKQISKADFEAQLQEAIQKSPRQKSQEYIKETERNSKSCEIQNELLKNNIALKVMQAENSFLEFKLNAEADKDLQEKGDFNPQVKRLRDEGRWQMPKMTRQQEMTQMQDENGQQREGTTRVR